MESPETEAEAVAALDRDLLEGPDPNRETSTAEHDQSWLYEIVDQLERDPQECWRALEGLVTVEADLRLSIIDELSALGARPGAQTLLRLLSSAHDPVTRSAARAALARIEGQEHKRVRVATPPALTRADPETVSRPDEVGAGRSVHFSMVSARPRPRLVQSLVTPVDGLGRGTIAVSVNQMEQRRTAAFWCDVQRGIRDVMGEVEPESPRAGRLIDALVGQPEAESVRDAPELALGLLAGSLLLCGPAVPARVTDWLLGTLGPGFEPAGFPATIPGLEYLSISHAEMPGRAGDVLDACPSWLDLSPLTIELAEEIWLREGRTASDPERDAGAYRFLFEHRLIHRLELYRRMLSWMAWFWKISGELELSRSALALAHQLADEQYAVPSHPFTVELTMRSLKAAQQRLGTAEDPRG
jgi:hypothetical protein